MYISKFVEVQKFKGDWRLKGKFEDKDKALDEAKKLQYRATFDREGNKLLVPKALYKTQNNKVYEKVLTAFERADLKLKDIV